MRSRTSDNEAPGNGGFLFGGVMQEAFDDWLKDREEDLKDNPTGEYLLSMVFCEDGVRINSLGTGKVDVLAISDVFKSELESLLKAARTLGAEVKPHVWN